MPPGSAGSASLRLAHTMELHSRPQRGRAGVGALPPPAGADWGALKCRVFGLPHQHAAAMRMTVHGQWQDCSARVLEPTA